MSVTELDRQLHTQVLKRQEAKEKAYRDERNRLEEEFHNKLGMGGSEMSKEELKKLIDSDRRMYYRTEELNDKLYIHYKGWRDLKNLDGWTGLKTLYAECNAFSTISGLHNCSQLRSLFLQENCITKISGLENCPELWSLNLSSNFIERIEGLENCKGLNTLLVAKNKIGFGGVADIEKLADTNICTVDIQDNRLEDPDIVPEVFARMKSLRVLYLKGNGAAKKIVNYRKSLTVYCKDMRYIDDRPVFEDDRRQAEAFNRGGIEEQRAEQKRIREEKNEQEERNRRRFGEMIEESRRQKKEKDAMRREDKFTDETDPVESFERRAKRLNDEWREENKEGLKDEAAEYAKKCLQAEREAKEREGKGQKDETQKANAEAREADAAGELDVPAENSEGEEEKVIKGTDEGSKKKEDNRKLVYEDIWDDGPSAKPEPEKKPDDNRKLVYDDIWDDVPSGVAPSASASSSSPARPPKSLAPAARSAGEEAFLPSSEGPGVVGMDVVAPSREAVAKRKAALQSEGQGQDEAAEAGDGKASWHSKYLEQMAKTQAKLRTIPTKPSVFAPPPRTAAPPADATKVEPSSESAAVASPPVGAGELDEMD